jgi:hypothetical protein
MFPSSATNRLENSVSATFDSIVSSFNAHVSTFLLERSGSQVADLEPQLRKLNANLGEAIYEGMLDKRIRGRKTELYQAIADSAARLSRNLAGLKSSMKVQAALLDDNQNLDLSKDSDTTIGIPATDGNEVIELFLDLHPTLGPSTRQLQVCSEQFPHSRVLAIRA